MGKKHRSKRNQAIPKLTIAEISSKPEISAMPKLIQPILPQESRLEKLWRFSESNLFWGGGIAVALAAYAFLLTGALKFSIVLLAASWVVITISIFKHKFFEKKLRKHQVIGNGLISLSIGVIFCLVWVWMQPQAIPVPTVAEQQKANTTITTEHKEPTFTEGVDAVSITIGSTIETLKLVDLQKAKRRFFIGDVPAFLYVDSGKPYVDVDIYSPAPLLPVRLRHNQLLNRPAEWDMNSDEKALEVINEKKQPVFQIYYKSPSQIVINGLFFNGYVPVLASEDGLGTGINLEKEPYPIKPLFKYPSSQYQGQRR